jgi:hypothetical protein
LRFTLAGAYAVLDNISQNLEMRNEFHGRDWKWLVAKRGRMPVLNLTLTSVPLRKENDTHEMSRTGWIQAKNPLQSLPP